jgi:hypothetical protein
MAASRMLTIRDKIVLDILLDCFGHFAALGRHARTGARPGHSNQLKIKDYGAIFEKRTGWQPT